MIDFVEALDPSEIDLLGFSIRGFVAQEIAFFFQAPEQVAADVDAFLV